MIYIYIHTCNARSKIIIVTKIKSVTYKHAQRSNVIWLSSIWLLIFRLKVANKRSLFTKPACTWIEISWEKDIISHGHKILYTTPGCYTGKMFANVSKIITNLFLTLQPDISKIICDLPNRTHIVWTIISSCLKMNLKISHKLR